MSKSLRIIEFDDINHYLFILTIINCFDVNIVEFVTYCF